MRRQILLLLPVILTCGCKPKGIPVPNYKYDDYGAFLGRNDNDVTGFSNYSYVSLELDEFGDSNIERLTSKGVHFLAYLNIGSLETYRDYYEDYESITFKDYENWPDERWIDVSNQDWQNFVVNTLAKGFKNRNAFGVYLDNVDVYSVAKEGGLDYTAYAQGLRNIIKGISDLNLFVMVNGGSEFFEDMNEQNSDVFDYLWAYHQEEVFSLIKDFENNTFGKQSDEDREYYQQISTMMKEKGKEVFYLEYTTDKELQNTIKEYCDSNKYHYYFANDVDLK